MSRAALRRWCWFPCLLVLFIAAPWTARAESGLGPRRDLEELLRLPVELPPSRSLAPWLDRQCTSVREAREVARELGVWDEAAVSAFAWSEVARQVDRLGALEAAAPVTGADSGDPDAAPDARAGERAWPPALADFSGSIAAVAVACDRMAERRGSGEALAALALLLAEGQDLSFSAEFFRQVKAIGPDPKAIAALARSLTSRAPLTERAQRLLPAAPPGEALVAQGLTALQREGVRKALDQLGIEVCRGKSRSLAAHLCEVVETFAAEPLERLPERLRAAARADLSSLPIHLVGSSPEAREVAAAVAIALLVVREADAPRGPVHLLARLSSLSCAGAASFVCGSQVGAATRQAGSIAALVLTETRWLEGVPLSTAEEAAVLVGVYRAGAPSVRSGDIEDVLRAMESFRAPTRGAPQRVSVAQLSAITGLLQRRLPSGAPARRALASVDRALIGWDSGDLAGVARATQELLRATKLTPPAGSDDLVSFIVRLATLDSAEAALEALANAPGVEQAAASLLGFQDVPGGTFADHPVRRKGSQAPAEGLAKYVAGLRASYVFQHWSPREIPAAHYSTTGLHLLRLELLLNQERLGFLRWVDGYFKFEIKPGGERAQDELLRAIRKEESGWESIVGNLHAALPFLSSARSLRGPAYSFKRRYFLASAQALEDYWYYSGGRVELLVPGDTVSTTTIFTRHRGGLRSTQLTEGGKPRWSYELGGYYLHYRKPYTHDRLASLPGSAIFDAAFQGGGGYVEGRLHFAPTGDEDTAWSATAALYAGPSNVVLDDVSAASVLPGRNAIFLGEAELGVEIPALWIGGAYFGGKLELNYRRFMDLGAADPERTNARNLNDDLILGVSLVGGYFL